MHEGLSSEPERETLRETPSTATDQNYSYSFTPHFGDNVAEPGTVRNGVFYSALKCAISQGESNEPSADQDTELKGLAELYARRPAPPIQPF